jgi:hypothetical protein
MPGAGTALLNALKARFYYLIAEDVLASAAAWFRNKARCEPVLGQFV